MKCSYCRTDKYLSVINGEIVCTNKHKEDNMICWNGDNKQPSVCDVEIARELKSVANEDAGKPSSPHRKRSANEVQNGN